VINSPNLAISRYNFRNQECEMRSPEQVRLVMSWLQTRGIEIVHVHSLEGFSLDLLPAIKAAGMRLVVTLHNHWYVCPQVDLLQRESGVCMDYRGGEACVHCLPAPDPKSEIWRRKMQTLAWSTLGPNSAKFAREAKATIAKTVGWSGATEDGAAATHDPAFVAADPRTASALAAPGNIVIPAGLPVEAQARDANEELLAKTHHLKVVNVYGQRRLAGLTSISNADCVIGPSRYITDVLVAMGLNSQKCKFVPYGQPHFDALRRVARGHAYFEKRPWNSKTSSRPLRFGFLGTVFPNKGLEVLTRAIPLLDQSVRQACHFAIRAYGDDAAFRHRLAPFPEVSFLGAYRYEDLASIHRDFDVAIVPHIWLENAPLVMLELLNSGKFMIMSRLGGVVDFICEPEGSKPGNGIYFDGGDPQDLAAAITRVATGAVEIPSPQEVQNVSPNLISYLEHVRQVEDVYGSVLMPSMR
jgi:glycosyltransferase involved in cell wall biosynthesis